MSDVRIAVLGAAGRMGRAVIQSAHAAGFPLGAAFEYAESPDIGKDAGALAGVGSDTVLISSDVAAAAGQFDVLTDFTRPEASMEAVKACVDCGKAMVIGTTGFSDGQLAEIDRAARSIAIVKAGNFSLGVNVCLQLLERAAAVLGPGFDIEVVEAHHRHKIDAPSGTALMMGEAAAHGAGLNLSEHAVYERYGQTGARPDRAVGFSTVRGGDVVGEHTVMFLGDGERVEIAHKASSRLNFSNGAIRAAGWVSNKPAGLYSMRDVLEV